MNEAKYIGPDVHQATISVSVLDISGKLLMEAILETKPATVLQWLERLVELPFAGFILVMAVRFFRRSGSEVSIHQRVGPWCSGTKSLD